MKINKLNSRSLVLCSKALDMYISVVILRLQEGLDYSKVIADEDDLVNGISSVAGGGEKGIIHTRQNSHESLPRNQSFSQMSQGELRTYHYNLHVTEDCGWGITGCQIVLLLYSWFDNTFILIPKVMPLCYGRLVCEQFRNIAISSFRMKWLTLYLIFVCCTVSWKSGKCFILFLDLRYVQSNINWFHFKDGCPVCCLYLIAILFFIFCIGITRWC